jgi:hypothetical protein
MRALAQRRLRPYGNQIVSLQRAVCIKDQYEVIAHTLPTFGLRVVTLDRETGPVASQTISENAVDLERFARITQMRDDLGLVDRFVHEKCEQVGGAPCRRYATSKRNWQEE